MATNEEFKRVQVDRAMVRHFEQMPVTTLAEMAEKMRQLVDVADVEFASLTATNLQGQIRELRQAQPSMKDSEQQIAEIDALYHDILEKRARLYRRH